MQIPDIDGALFPILVVPSKISFLIFPYRK